MRILVVDDDVRLCSVLERGLTEEGYAVDVAHDGEEGEYLAEAHPYDLVILDVMMPKLDGLSVCRNLRAAANSAPVLIVYIGWYNAHRLHRSLKGRTPLEVLDEYNQQQTAARATVAST
jgi:CheY-like chemotaxis protein